MRSGVLRLLGVGSGDPTSHESDKMSRRRSFNGRCLAIVQASRETGAIAIKAEAAGLKSATAIVRVD